MSRIDLNNPETWNKPGWKANSCYINTALWALFYNDIYIDLIRRTPLIPNSNHEIVGYEGEIQTALIHFYEAIHSSQQMSRVEVYSITENIRNNLSLLTQNNDWLLETFDPAEFLMQISEIFENVNNCNINSNLLPFIRVSDLNINAYGKKVTFNMFGDGKSCDFIHDGLIVQYGDGRDAILEEKYYSIGKYKLYAFLHWFGRGHYNCYFEFNNKWYIFDDTDSYIREVLEVKRKTIYNQSFLFFYKFDESISTDENVTLTDYFARDNRTLSIIDNDEPDPQSQKLAASEYYSDEWESPDDFFKTKNWLEVFNRCNSIEKDKKAQETEELDFAGKIEKLGDEYVEASETRHGDYEAARIGKSKEEQDRLKQTYEAENEAAKTAYEVKLNELESKLKEFNKNGGTKRKQIIKCKSSKKNRNYNKRKKTRKNKKIKKHKKSRKT